MRHGKLTVVYPSCAIVALRGGALINVTLSVEPSLQWNVANVGTVSIAGHGVWHAARSSTTKTSATRM